MIIRSFCVENFRCYRNRVCIEFLPPEKEQNVYLIGGMNGHGKTTLREALKVCLFGIAGQPRLIADQVNRANMKEGKHDVFLCLSFEEGGKIYVVERRYYTRGWAHGTWDMQLQVSVDGKCYEGEDAQDIINQIFPPDIADFFLFDGEEIKSLADKTEEDTAQQIRESMEIILGLRILRTLQQDLTKVQNDYAREGSVQSYDRLQSLERQRRALEDQAKSDRERLDTLRTELQRIKQRLEKHQDDLDKIRNSYENYEQLGRRLRQLEQ